MSAQNLTAELQNCKTLNEIIATANKYYDLDQQLGVVMKPLAISGVKKAITQLNIKPRTNGR